MGCRTWLDGQFPKTDKPSKWIASGSPTTGQAYSTPKNPPRLLFQWNPAQFAPNPNHDVEHPWTAKRNRWMAVSLYFQ